MALNQTNKLVWIVETIYRAHKISFEEMLKRTFHKWKWNIFDTFGLSIECETTAPHSIKLINKYTL